MWGHMIKLASPDGRNQVAFMITSERKMHSVSACMAEVDFLRRFRDWTLIKFLVAEGVPETPKPTTPGSLINVTV